MAPVRPRSRLLRASLVALLLTIGLATGTDSVASMREQPASEYQIKAIFLYNFAKFVDWPDTTFATARDPFTLCILGDDPFGNELDLAVKGKTVNGREISIIRTSKLQETKPCQIAFIGSSDKRQIHLLLEHLRSSSILTVGETEGFVQWGGTINFILSDNRVRFDINVAAADRAKLRISAKLLSLAKTVLKGGRG